MNQQAGVIMAVQLVVLVLMAAVNHAIMIRTFLSRNNTLVYQAGAGVVAASNPESELQEVNNKLNALKQAIVLAQNISSKSLKGTLKADNCKEF